MTKIIDVVTARVTRIVSIKICGELIKINGAITSAKLAVAAPVYLCTRVYFKFGSVMAFSFFNLLKYQTGIRVISNTKSLNRMART